MCVRARIHLVYPSPRHAYSNNIISCCSEQALLHSSITARYALVEDSHKPGWFCCGMRLVSRRRENSVAERLHGWCVAVVASY